jgi:myo-inositol-1-phosphate synthase
LAKTGDHLGIWLIGAAGNVATTVAVGLAALRRGLTAPIGLLTESPICRNLGLSPLSRITLGGHEIARRTVLATAEELHTQSGIFGESLLRQVRPDLKKLQSAIRPGIKAGHGVRPAIEQCRRDLRQFAKSRGLSRMVMINLASTEPLLRVGKQRKWSDLERALAKSGEAAIPPSTAYAIAAIQENIPYVNFTPSLGANHPAVLDLAAQHNVPVMGADAKTGETLLKSVLAPMFDARRLDVMSWTGTNILGNRDGQTLREPRARAAKLRGKDQALSMLLSENAQTHTAIDFVGSMHDWKTAWDHIHFRGFLDTKMTLQFIWQGCDSALAAPLVIDLARLADLHAQLGRGGVMSHLACFFKSPMDADSHRFFEQMQILQKYLDSARAERRR